MAWIARIFALTGRSPRKAYWLTTLPCVLVMLMAMGPLVGETPTAPDWVLLVASAVVLIALMPILTVSVRRLHDRNKPWWWMLIYWLVPALFGPSIDGQGALFPGLPEAANGALMLLSSGISIWSFVDLGILKGTPGPNRFGPDPFGRGVAEVFT